ncbi:MAG: M28 family peptidase [Myxococcales bacterium]|nr:M28 family peptidase [Myxococcales bacterium]
MLVALVAAGCSDSDTKPDAGDAKAGEGTVGDTGSGDTSTTPYTPLIAEAELKRIVSALADDNMDGRDEGTPGGDKARAYVIDELKKCNVTPAGDGGTFEQKITAGKGTNVIGKIEGSGSAAEKARHVVISAHFDHLGNCQGQICNGADDNAAGVAIVIRVACALAKSPPKRSVIVALWDAEEPPTFLTAAMGSAFWVAHPTLPLASVDAALVLDLVGGNLWPGYQNHFVLGAELSPEVKAAVIAAAKPPALDAQRASLHLVEKTPLGDQPWSDYHDFRLKNIPVLFFSNGQNKAYHTGGDEIAGLNLPKMTLEADWLLSITEQLGNRSGDAAPTFNATAMDNENDASALVKVIEAALDPEGLAKMVGSVSRGNLKKDLDAVKAAKAKVDGGGQLSAAEVGSLRSAVQRIMCLAGTSYPENICNIL